MEKIKAKQRRLLRKRMGISKSEARNWRKFEGNDPEASGLDTSKQGFYHQLDDILNGVNPIIIDDTASLEAPTSFGLPMLEPVEVLPEEDEGEIEVTPTPVVRPRPRRKATTYVYDLKYKNNDLGNWDEADTSSWTFNHVVVPSHKAAGEKVPSVSASATDGAYLRNRRPTTPARKPKPKATFSGDRRTMGLKLWDAVVNMALTPRNTYHKSHLKREDPYGRY